MKDKEKQIDTSHSSEMHKKLLQGYELDLTSATEDFEVERETRSNIVRFPLRPPYKQTLFRTACMGHTAGTEKKVATLEDENEKQKRKV